jgi:hypothetical protein
MADAADIASIHDFTDEVLRRHRKKVEAPVERGICLNCEAPVGANMLYCDSGCREDYEREQRIKTNTRR